MSASLSIHQLLIEHFEFLVAVVWGGYHEQRPLLIGLLSSGLRQGIDMELLI